MWWLDPSGSGPGAEDIRDGHFPTLHRLEGPEDVKLHHHLVPGELCAGEGDEPVQLLGADAGPLGSRNVIEGRITLLIPQKAS